MCFQMSASIFLGNLTMTGTHVWAPSNSTVLTAATQGPREPSTRQDSDLTELRFGFPGGRTVNQPPGPMTLQVSAQSLPWPLFIFSFLF